ncbi:cytochrome c [Paracoccus sp. Z118]|uniref:c-type cytochrome n=1 Tax=Paracoccus sp. Z118 TaxID=2851017 RepID=UPI001C2C858B|nr:cytochrome c [Paracoccus sp. Z118]MBV0890799.1 cytochrome c [Paracoccus sp. Z118]
MRLILAAAILLTPVAALAQDDAQRDALKARQGYMTAVATNMGPLAAMAKGDLDYDEALATFHARNLAALGNYEVEMHFLPGTAQGEVEGSHALPAAWQNLDDVRAKHNDFTAAAAAAPEGVKGGREQVAAVVQSLGGTCKACHDQYRAK